MILDIIHFGKHFADFTALEISLIEPRNEGPEDFSIRVIQHNLLGVCFHELTSQSCFEIGGRRAENLLWDQKFFGLRPDNDSGNGTGDGVSVYQSSQFTEGYFLIDKVYGLT
jgi:hypothetical protein